MQFRPLKIMLVSLADSRDNSRLKLAMGQMHTKAY